MDQTTLKAEPGDEETCRAVHLAPIIESGNKCYKRDVGRKDGIRDQSSANEPVREYSSSVHTGILLNTTKQEPTEQYPAIRLSLSVNDATYTNTLEPVPVGLYKVADSTIKSEYLERDPLESDTTYASSITNELNVSIFKERGKKQLKCTLCSYTTTCRGSLTRHRRIHSHEKPYKCSICTYTSSRKDTLTKHEAMHSDQSATGNNTKSATAGVLIQHDMCRTGETPCIFYQTPFRTALNTGQRRDEATYKCSLFPYSSNREACLGQHERMHKWQQPMCSSTNTQMEAPDQTETCSKDLPFRYMACTSSTTDKREFVNHKKRDRKENSHKCPICPFSGATPYSLKVHERTHTGEKPYKCSICDYSTARKGDLRSHEQVCSAERQYTCPVCQYRTGSKMNHTIHERSHAVTILYQCPHCRYATDKKGDMSRHEKNHNANKAFRCPLCLYSTGTLGSITKHLALHSTADKSTDLSLLLPNVGPSSETGDYTRCIGEEN